MSDTILSMQLTTAAPSQLGHLNMISDGLFHVMVLLYVQTWPEYV